MYEFMVGMTVGMALLASLIWAGTRGWTLTAHRKAE